MTSLIGRRLGRYEIRAELGRGGMARVYRGVDTQLQRPVAIKILAAQLSLDPEYIRRFEREATTAANLRHPAIVTIYDVGEEEGLHYIAMEYVAGRSLNAMLEERTILGLGYAVSLLDPVARALDYAHALGAVHRDVKPHNILIDHDGRVLLTDFGIAQTPDSDGERLTRTGLFMGTPEYISPEQAEARRVDGRSDLYALAVVAYEIITGRVPFSGTAPQLIVAHAQLPPPPPSSLLPHLPQELDAVLTKALAKRPEERFASGLELVEALRAVATRYGMPLATREQLAALADPVGITPRPLIPQAIPAPPPRSRPSDAPAPSPVAAPRAAPVAIGGAPTTPAPRPPAVLPAPRPPTTDWLSRTGESGRTRQAGDGSTLPLLLLGVLLVMVTAAFIFIVARSMARVTPPQPAIPTPGLRMPSPLPATGAPATPRDPEGTALPLPAASPTPAPTSGPPTLGTALPLPAASPTPAPTLPPPTVTVPPPPSPTAAPLATIPPTATPAPTSTPEDVTPTATSTAELTPTPTLATSTPTASATALPTPSPTDEPTILGSPTVVTPVLPYP
ncbi:MAG: protein kinase domain-containing protein [Chloroflexaceae bacterium]